MRTIMITALTATLLACDAETDPLEDIRYGAITANDVVYYTTNSDLGGDEIAIPLQDAIDELATASQEMDERLGLVEETESAPGPVGPQGPPGPQGPAGPPGVVNAAGIDWLIEVGAPISAGGTGYVTVECASVSDTAINISCRSAFFSDGSGLASNGAIFASEIYNYGGGIQDSGGCGIRHAGTTGEIYPTITLACVSP
jgi:hypothetical protein